MATERSAHTEWRGNLQEGTGQVSFDTSGVGTFDVTWKARAEQAGGKTSPEELIAAAHSACYSMQFSALLTDAGFVPELLETHASVGFDPSKGGITGSALTVKAKVPGIDSATFAELAGKAKTSCPVSKALSGIDISLTTTLEN